MYETISLFSGGLGLDLGLELAGIRTVVVQEMDADCISTIKTNRPHLNIVPGDLAALVASDPKCRFLWNKHYRPFAVVGGPPCQSFSTAGKMMAFEDERGRLIRVFSQVIHALRPKLFVMENVKGIQKYVSETMNLFSQIGYHMEYRILNAADYGAPQKRERFVLIGRRDSGQIIFPTRTHGGKRNYRTLHDAIGDLHGDMPGMQFSTKRAKVMEKIPEGGNWKSLPPEMQHLAIGNANTSSGGMTAFYRRLSWDKPAPTLVTSPSQRSTTLAHPSENRPLSIMEYARIQGFPDTWKFHGSISSQYRQIGNAIPVALGRALGLALKRM